jgi:flagella basal body P-ring formation protein FlgA
VVRRQSVRPLVMTRRELPPVAAARRPSLSPLLVAALFLLFAFSARVVQAQQVTQLASRDTQQPARPIAASPGARRVAVAAHALSRGEVLAADDIEFRDTTSARAMSDTNQIVPGWVTRRAISAGEVLRSPAVEPPVIVGANQPVEIEWQDQNIRMIVHGTATRNASMGERVSVRTESGRRIEATVVAPGRVRID